MGRTVLRLIVGFRGRAGPVSETYSARCRAVGDAVAGRYAGMDDASGPDGGADARGWLEARLAEAASTADAVAGAMLRGRRSAPTGPDDLLALRTVAWLELGRPGGRLWEGGPESRGTWSFLLSPTATGVPDLWWLASSHRLDVELVRALVGSRLPSNAIGATPRPVGRRPGR